MGVEKITFPFYIYLLKPDLWTDGKNCYRIDAYNKRVMCKEKTSCLFYLGSEKIVFSYFYISSFCCLTDKPTDKILI